MSTKQTRSAFAKAAFAACLLAVAAPARAGDTATVEVLGFSADGRVFAFEQYGVQDGSGFPYADRFYIDTTNDSFLAGTPVRVRIDNEEAGPAEARAEVQKRSQSVMPDATLAANRGFAAGSNPVTEISGDPMRMVVNPRPVFPPIDDPLEFRLDEIPMAESERCHDLGDLKGFRLVRIAAAPGSEARLVHEDARVPQSRGCSLGYSIAGIQTFYPEAGEPVFAVLIAMRLLGFEGPDHRFIAVTGPIGN